MRGVRRFGGAAPRLFVLALALAPLPATAAGCPADVTRRVEARGLDPHGDVALADGTVLRLAALADPDGAPDAARRAGLDALVAGRTLALAGVQETPDRYGRLVGLARFEDGTSVQEAALSRGLALARPEPGYLDCLESLLAAERPARMARRGVWAQLPLRAEEPATISARAGHFSVVAGRILTVGNRTRFAYLNFGPVWRQDTTVRLEGTARDALAQSGRPVPSLAGQVVTVRGEVYEADGPAIDLRWTGQLQTDEEIVAP